MTQRINTFSIVFMILLGMGMGIQSCQNAVEGTTLFTQFYETYPNVITDSNGEGEEGQSNLNQAMQLYESKQFEAAKDLLQKIEGVAEVDFYLGIIEIELNQYRKAEKLLLEVYDETEHPFKVPARYYLGLLALQEEEKELAKIYLNEL